MSNFTINIDSQVLTYANLAAFPVTGAAKTIYIAKDTNTAYYYDSGYVAIGGGGGTFVESVTGDGVDNTDPLNPVLTFPTPNEIGAEPAKGADDNYVTDAQLIVIQNTSGTNSGDNAANTTANAYADGKVADEINNGTTTIAPSQNAVFDALALKENSISAGTTAQYWRGDKTFQTLDKTAVGLGNVDNTSDANKPVSTATQTALNLKSNLASPTFTGTVTTPAIVVSSETASRVAIIDASNNVKSADTTTYPSLTELAYLKNVTSALQTQLDRLPFFILNHSSFSPLDSSTYSVGMFASLAPTLSTAGGFVLFKFSYTKTIKKVLVVARFAVAGSNEASAISLRNQTTSTDYSIGNLDYSINILSSNTWAQEFDVSIDVNKTDYYFFKEVTPAWATNPTNVARSIYFY